MPGRLSPAPCRLHRQASGHRPSGQAIGPREGARWGYRWCIVPGARAVGSEQSWPRGQGGPCKGETR
jgi:hypothetical protein